MPRYKYSSAHEWLADYINEADSTTLRGIARELAEALNSDEIQSCFQSDMDRDGFFVDLDRRKRKRHKL